MLIRILLLCTVLVCLDAFKISSPILKRTSLFQYKNFDDMLTNIDKPVLVDFYAEWCGPCKMMQPVLQDVALRLENVARVAKVDTDKSPRLGNRFQVEALPTLILFNKGEIVEKFIGYRSADELEQVVRDALSRLQSAGKL